MKVTIFLAKKKRFEKNEPLLMILFNFKVYKKDQMKATGLQFQSLRQSLDYN